MCYVYKDILDPTLLPWSL